MHSIRIIPFHRNVPKKTCKVVVRDAKRHITPEVKQNFFCEYFWGSFFTKL